MLRSMLSFALVCVLPLAAQAETPSAKQLAARGVSFLKTSQDEDGSYSSFAGTGVTSLVTAGVLRSDVPASDPTVAKAIEYILKHQQKDGGIYAEGSTHKNYETALAVLCLSEANKDGKYDEVIKKADGFLKGMQWDEEDGTEPDSYSYGGGGYGRHERPDLSNTSFLIDALKAAGNGPDDPAMQKALVFVSRTQNLESKHNATPFAAKVGDGGFYYTPAAGGSSQAGETANGGLRSYGSMTYAGLKSMIYAGVDKDDPRVKAAYGWIQKNYTLEQNPGMGTSGHFYYFHTFAKALNAMDIDEIESKSGTKHKWQDDLVAKLADMQQENGSWINSDQRWLEADPNLVTGYVLLSLSYCD